eukprot:15397333-Alexandrium_andersonii.AAC.1
METALEEVVFCILDDHNAGQRHNPVAISSLSARPSAKACVGGGTRPRTSGSRRASSSSATGVVGRGSTRQGP